MQTLTLHPQHPPAYEVSDHMHLKVLEIYPAVQGEGNFIGVPSTFVRLAGCTVGCIWCDTKYSWKAAQGIEYTPSELAERTFHHTTHEKVVLTGGEPMEHPQHLLFEYLQLLQPRMQVTIETSGTVFPSQALTSLQNILWSVSPKLKAAHTTRPHVDLASWFNTVPSLQIQLKFVVSDLSELEEVRELVGTMLTQLRHGHYNFNPIIIQPVSPTRGNESSIRETIAERLRALQEYIVETRYLAPLPLRVVPQLHAMLYGNRRGV